MYPPISGDSLVRSTRTRSPSRNGRGRDSMAASGQILMTVDTSRSSPGRLHQFPSKDDTVHVFLEPEQTSDSRH